MLSLMSFLQCSPFDRKTRAFEKQKEGGAGCWLLKGCLVLAGPPCRVPRGLPLSPTVLGPQRAVAGRAAGVRVRHPRASYAQDCAARRIAGAGGSPASAVGRLPARLCPAFWPPSVESGIGLRALEWLLFPWRWGSTSGLLAGGGELLGYYSPALYPAERLCPGGQLYSGLRLGLPAQLLGSRRGKRAELRKSA